jgi:hypothetical protein
MLRSLNKLKGYHAHALDNDIGKVAEFYFDDGSWVVRYMVVSLTKSGRKVLISPVSMLQPVWAEKIFPLSITQEQVEASPDIDTEKPVERWHEEEIHRHYAWDFYWASEVYMGGPALDITEPEKSGAHKTFDSHLHTTSLVTGYRIQAIDGTIGHVTDFIVDDFSWVIRYLVVDTSILFPGKHVLISPDMVKSISPENHRVLLETTRNKVRNSPLYNPADLVNRGQEEVLCDYYGRPKYWLGEHQSHERYQSSRH